MRGTRSHNRNEIQKPKQPSDQKFKCFFTCLLNKNTRDYIDYEYAGTFRRLSQRLGLVFLFDESDELSAYVFDFQNMEFTQKITQLRRCYPMEIIYCGNDRIVIYQSEMQTDYLYFQIDENKIKFIAKKKYSDDHSEVFPFKLYEKNRFACYSQDQRMIEVNELTDIKVKKVEQYAFNLDGQLKEIKPTGKKHHFIIAHQDFDIAKLKFLKHSIKYKLIRRIQSNDILRLHNVLPNNMILYNFFPPNRDFKFYYFLGNTKKKSYTKFNPNNPERDRQCFPMITHEPNYKTQRGRLLISQTQGYNFLLLNLSNQELISLTKFDEPFFQSENAKFYQEQLEKFKNNQKTTKVKIKFAKNKYESYQKDSDSEPESIDYDQEVEEPESEDDEDPKNVLRLVIIKDINDMLQSGFRIL